MMAIGTSFAVVCLESIEVRGRPHRRPTQAVCESLPARLCPRITLCMRLQNGKERELVRATLASTGHEIVDITRAQMNKFCG